MSEEKLLFKCNITTSTKDLNEANKVIFKKRIGIVKIIYSLFMISLFVVFTWYNMYNYDLFLIEAIGYFLSYKPLVILYIFFIIFILKDVEVTNWIVFYIIRFKRKNIKKPVSHIDFYESYYEMPIFDKATKTYPIVRINYSDITNFFTSENLYILCVFKGKALKIVTIIRKDYFIEGTEQNFIKFIGLKPIKSHLLRKAQSS